MRRRTGGLGIVAGIVVLLGVSGAPPARAAELQKAKVALVTITIQNLPVWVAQEKGFFRSAGLDAEVDVIETVTNAVRAVSAGSINLQATCVPDAAITAIRKGAPVKIIGGVLDKPMYDLIAQKKYRTIKDLKGTTLGVSTLTSGSTLLLETMMTANGLEAEKDYRLLAVGGTPSRMAAVKNGGVSATLVTEPTSFLAEEDGLQVLDRTLRYLPHFEFLVMIGNSQWMQAHRGATVAFLRAIIRADRWLYDSRHEEEASRILARYTHMKEVYARRAYQDHFLRFKAFPRQAEIDMPALQEVIKVMVKNNRLPREYPAREFVDDSYRQQALQGM